MHCELTTLLLRQFWECHLIESYLKKTYHLPVELEHRTLRAIKQLNFHLSKAGELKRLQFSELEEIRNEAYGNTRITKSRTKLFHDQIIT